MQTLWQDFRYGVRMPGNKPRTPLQVRNGHARSYRNRKATVHCIWYLAREMRPVIRRLPVSPDGKEKLELFGPRDGFYGFLNRKNALFYKTLNGAGVGDLFMSLIHTCELNKVNPFDYLTELQKQSGALKQKPSEWMPWNSRATVARLAMPAAA